MPISNVAEVVGDLARELDDGRGAHRRVRGERVKQCAPADAVGVEEPLELGNAGAALDEHKGMLCRVCLKGVAARKRLPNQNGKREDVGALINHVAPDLLGRHVAHGTASRVSVAGSRGKGGHAKVADLNVAGMVEEDV